MTQQDRSIIGNGIALLICGLGIGWLLGLATTPVLSIVLTSVIAAVAAVAAVLMRLPKESSAKGPEPASKPASLARGATAIPLAIIVFGLAIGAPAGLTAREYRWFTPPPAQSTQEADGDVRISSSPGLFNDPIARRHCEEMVDRIDDPDVLPQLMRQGSPPLQAAASRTQDHEALTLVVGVLCDSTLWRPTR